jgi:hypothetical protein
VFKRVWKWLSGLGDAPKATEQVDRWREVLMPAARDVPQVP